MKNLKCILEYDGTDFHGWQKQQGQRTVQGVMEEAIEKIHGEKVQVHGAGRTDAGVHAWGQVCSFTIDTRLSVKRIARAVSSKLPGDVRIRSAEEVPLDFHARFSALSRRYIYYLRTEPTAIWRRFFYVVRYSLDAAAMKKAARYLLGERDFASFTTAQASKDGTTQCLLTELDVQQTGAVISFTAEADHFLHNMVRIIVGTLLEVGRGKILPEQLKEIACKKDRNAAGPTVPPNGLFLLEVEYPE
ncbi:MAG: tRNA pseudouridine(38-40) synthase TruA [Candidatus Latescibacteria bacterium]|nr:tRNA pseudouridine(38-40) synthase TruA [Candidatus Latescibacterota bacterium]NIM22072.1 tRNA pseudouridine(38-40) synthase TruA [Candidatus Latescibacterota bacterium]NIM66091.1 tRNA pseudouridine(38-40) synthase TruA [Candidatus Latescibacterota bacterium]NIO02499.1 tRNA pseudouridine(38-40) synthase TruA [Candidatus Latescibacterota bacterium]NIO29410.1 tRNA pseudouridine(38-40) synthase TruA [Candidatus Latescibacterota bacterium]